VEGIFSSKPKRSLETRKVFFLCFILCSYRETETEAVKKRAGGGRLRLRTSSSAPAALEWHRTSSSVRKHFVLWTRAP
jgi:hypothetical protein